MGTPASRAVDGRRSWRGPIGIVLASVLIASCGSAGSSPTSAESTATSTTQADASVQSAGPEAPGTVLVDLGDAAAVAAWTTVNDPVMGGRSTSTVAFGNGGLVFSGNVSLENNGGFASARSPEDPDLGRRATGATSLRVRAQGDGKTYLLKVGIQGRPWSYVQRFRTEAAAQKTYELPVSAFQPVGMRLDPEPAAPAMLDPSAIDQVAVYILDKQPGPFQITVDAIDATV